MGLCLATDPTRTLPPGQTERPNLIGTDHSHSNVFTRNLTNKSKPGPGLGAQAPALESPRLLQSCNSADPPLAQASQTLPVLTMESVYVPLQNLWTLGAARGKEVFSPGALAQQAGPPAEAHAGLQHRTQVWQ